MDGVLPAACLSESRSQALRDLAQERGLNEAELWDSICALALENGAERARRLLDEAETELAAELFRVPDTEAWVRTVLASGFLPFRRCDGRLKLVAPAPRVPVADALQSLAECVRGTAGAPGFVRAG